MIKGAVYIINYIIVIEDKHNLYLHNVRNM